MGFVRVLPKESVLAPRMKRLAGDAERVGEFSLVYVLFHRMSNTGVIVKRTLINYTLNITNPLDIVKYNRTSQQQIFTFRSYT